MKSQVDIHTTPAMEAPHGVTSNLVNPYSTHRYLVITSALCLSLSLSAVAARTFTKTYVVRKLQIEDYSLICAGVGFAAFTAVMLAAGHAGQGRHQWDVSIAGVQKIAFFANILEIVYPPVMFAAKFTVLFQIKRIFTAHQKNFIYWSVQGLVAANFLTYFSCFVAFIFACWPREKIWSPDIPGKCISTNASIIATSAINVISDVTILLLPIYAIVQLHLPIIKKIGVSAIFATGAFACISSVIRLVYSIRLTRTHDVTWAIAPVGMWALVEFATVILVACFPTFPRLLQFFQKTNPDSKYLYDREPDRNYAMPSNEHSPNSWYDGSIKKAKGSYIPLEVRKICSGSEVKEDCIDRYPLTHTTPSGICKKVEIDMVSS